MIKATAAAAAAAGAAADDVGRDKVVAVVVAAAAAAGKELRAVCAAEALHHTVDAADVVVAAANELEQAINRVLQADQQAGGEKTAGDAKQLQLSAAPHAPELQDNSQRHCRLGWLCYVMLC